VIDFSSQGVPQSVLGAENHVPKTNHKLRAVYCSRCWPCPCRQTRSSNSCRKCATQAHGMVTQHPRTHFCWPTKSLFF
jgi:hypothetical protein